MVTHSILNLKTDEHAYAVIKKIWNKLWHIPIKSKLKMMFLQRNHTKQMEMFYAEILKRMPNTRSMFTLSYVVN